MGREIKRVALDFDWPLDKPWSGYMRPDCGESQCPDCVGLDGDATGYSRIGKTLHSLTEGDYEGQILPLSSDKVSPSETALMDALDRATGSHSHGFVMGTITDPRAFTYCLMEHLATSLGVDFETTFLCARCKGHGSYVTDADLAAVYEAWERTEPPPGEGWQLWETVSEGSPITPVFATDTELAHYLCTVGSTWDRSSLRRGEPLPTWEQAMAMVNRGWTPSGYFVVAPTGAVVASASGTKVAALLNDVAVADWERDARELRREEEMLRLEEERLWHEKEEFLRRLAGRSR